MLKAKKKYKRSNNKGLGETILNPLMRVRRILSEHWVLSTNFNNFTMWSWNNTIEKLVTCQKRRVFT